MTVVAKAIAELVEQFVSTVYADSKIDGMRSAQWAALRYFADVEPTARTVGNFARHNLITDSSASQTVSSLVRRGYLEKTPSEEDGRSHQLHLTDSAYKILVQDPLNLLVNAIDDLNAKQKTGLADLLHEIYISMQNRRS
ncbi:MAG: DNA-binding MarR family transcriptional regulator [Alphaproteobacteria bacterium]|jgi:DNA-binding MarR family transcriptional regulator